MDRLQLPTLSESQQQIVNAILASFQATNSQSSNLPPPPPPADPVQPPAPQALPAPPQHPAPPEPLMSNANEILSLEQALHILEHPTRVINDANDMWSASGGTVWHYVSPDAHQAEDWRSVGYL